MGFAIITRFKGPTNSTGSRYSASAGGKPGGGSDRASVSADNALSPIRNRVAVARALATRLEWDGLWIAGGLDGSDVVFVRMPVSSAKAAELAAMMLPASEGEDWFLIPAPATMYASKGQDGFYELRQTRFRDKRASNNGEGHPHDVCAVNPTLEGLREMAANHFPGVIDYSEAESA